MPATSASSTVQARSLADQRFRSLDIPYRGAAVDPERRFVPLRPPFVMPVGRELQAIFSPAAAVLDGVFVALSDYRGMILRAFLSAVLILWLAWRLTGGPEAAAMPIVLGFGSPLWFYGMIGWEHAPAVALGALAFFVAARNSSLWNAALAGVLLGCGAAIRDEVILLAPGLAFALWLVHRDLKRAAVAAAGIVAVLGAAGAVEVWWFHRPLAAHFCTPCTCSGASSRRREARTRMSRRSRRSLSTSATLWSSSIGSSVMAVP